MAQSLLQVVTTTAEKKDAEDLATAILKKRLAACVQIGGPIESRYWWNGRLETTLEYVLTIKTHRDCYPKLEKLLAEIHPYDEPEIVATVATKVSAGYQKWLQNELRVK
jgi:periplasmic divalent cation tolerance protein